MSLPDDQSLLEGLRTGSEQAAQRLFDEYAERLVHLARRRLSQRLGRRVDPEDIVQSVFRTFFARAKEGEFALARQDDLCKLLYRLTVRKTLRRIQHHRAAKRSVAAEQEPADDAGGVPRAVDSNPTPDAVAVFIDQMEHFFRRLSPEERQILEMRMEGCTTEEIARRLGTYDRKVYRALERIRGIAEKEDLAG